MIDSIHDFQRQGGLNTQFAHLDKVFSTYLVAPTEEKGVDKHHAPEEHHHSDDRHATENKYDYVESEEQ